jgi:hypothetical protein
LTGKPPPQPVAAAEDPYRSAVRGGVANGKQTEEAKRNRAQGNYQLMDDMDESNF